MLSSRVIPCLLVQDGGLVKTVKFNDSKYVGDPINAVRIFNEKKADELIVLDIDASANNAEPDYKMIENIAKECRMPLCYGGGIKNLAHAVKIVTLGVEKIALSSILFDRPNLIVEIANKIGLQSVVIVLDVKKKFLSGSYNVWTLNGKHNTKKNVVDVIKQVQSLGVGEIILNFIDFDGTEAGYPIEDIQRLKNVINVPLTVMGGAKSLENMSDAIKQCGLMGVAAGSLFVFKGKYRAVLINYPEQQQKEEFIHGK
ncbi:MAG: AglZ/HisF2 family acetamidino modification protein [Methylophilaceae bacterium]|jgi:imidazole glycerol-phosphate synthase subunit HisF|nr:AglZ/HisF2 family acetamidino modification protein [Methylophilaceae bacterium]